MAQLPGRLVPPTTIFYCTIPAFHLHHYQEKGNLELESVQVAVKTDPATSFSRLSDTAVAA